MTVVVRVENVSKKYQLGRIGTQSLKGDFKRWWARKSGKGDPFTKIGESMENKDFWALRDISFDIHQGDAVGIIGRNGAGKSTLLKILSRITNPTTGNVKLKGRIASLLEVGTGFNPDLTGRENIFLNGAILGMTKREVKAKLDEIINFSGIEKFIDTPVKRYSSGMYVRLAFAVAAHLESEILILDEVLAVGDAEFQKKCLGKMDDVAHKQGRTVLFVSHNMQAVSTLTEKCIFLKKGNILYQGDTLNAINYYLEDDTPKKDNVIYKSLPSNAKPTITRFEVLTSQPNNTHINGNPLEFLIDIFTPRPIVDAGIAIQVINKAQQPILNLSVFDSDTPFLRERGNYRIACRIEKCRLYMGNYNITLHFAEFSGTSKIETIENICHFEVAMFGKNRNYPWKPNECIYVEDSKWAVEMYQDSISL